MPKFVIEREIPGAGKLSPQELQAISQKSCGVLSSMGPQIQWVQSYVTDDKVRGDRRAGFANRFGPAFLLEHARIGESA